MSLQTLAVRAASAVSLALLVTALSGCGGGGGSAPAPSVRPLAALEPVGAGTLVPRVRELLRSRDTARMANPGAGFDRFVVSPTPAAGSQPGTTAQVSSTAPPIFSGTTVQEAGIDEADLLKTNGRFLFALDGYTLRDAQGTPRPQVRLGLARADGQIENVSTMALEVGAEPADWIGKTISKST